MPHSLSELREALGSLDLPPRATITTLDWARASGDHGSSSADADHDPLDELDDVLPPTPAGRAELGDFAIVDKLGQGGMGVVHAAHQSSLEREVALKMPLPNANASTRQALVNEARTTGRLEHPNIPPVHSLWSQEGTPLLVMKRIRGVPWEDLLHDDAHPAWATTRLHDDPRLVRHVKLLIDVTDALHFAHSHGIVHRDLKPENVMVGAFGEVYLLDWGVAAPIDTLTQPMGNLVGTPAYMAPEMTEGRADARTDVFLSGAVLHEVLTGEPRTMGKGLFDTLMKAANPTPYDYPEHLPPQLVAICRKATAPDPDDRYQTVRELQEALADWLRHRGAEELANEAQRRLDAARAGDDNAGELLIEAHFGFTTALREWPDHEGAQRGLEQCQVERVRRALDDGQLQLAEALLAKVGEPSEQLEEEVAALREAYARQAELHARAKQLDFTVSARERAVFVVVMLSLAVFLWGLRFVYGETPVVGPRDVAYPACGLAVLGMGAAVYWKKLVRNQVSQQWLLTLLGTVFAWLVCRLLGWWHELHISVVMSFDLLVLGLGAGLFALWTARWIAPGLLFNAAAIVAIALAPEWHLYAFLFAFVGSMSWIGVGWMRGWGREPGAA